MYVFPIPDNSVTFTALVCDLLNAGHDWELFDKWGRNGQEQFGVDIYSSSLKIVIQCKWKDINRGQVGLFKEAQNEFKEHIELIKKFKLFPARRFIFVTTIPEDTTLQALAVNYSTEQLEVEFWGWSRINRMLLGYPSIIKKYYPNGDIKNRFSTHRTITERHFSSSQKNIFLNSYLPNHYNLGNGSCAISFKSEDIPMISLTSNDINEILKSRDKSVERNITLNATKEENNRWFIRLGTSAYFTTEDEKTELCYVLDDFLNEYEKAYDAYKKKLGVATFEIIDTDYVKILTLSRTLWLKILKFSQEFDFDNGDSEWHIFNSNPAFIIAHHKNDTTYNAWIVAKATRSSVFTTSNDHDEVDILWKIPDISTFHKGACWNAETTANWLQYKLIPEVIAYFNPPKLSLLQLIIKKLKGLFGGA